ncbi:MAG: DNA polymerase III subunit delta [Pseudomonadota bacterium]|nr:DNA polymerase III subunit delta [Pseudomonadota bacterium]
MRLKPEQLDRHLNEPLEPVYFVGGDELLLIEDVCVAIVKAAGEQGFSERERFDIGSGTDWADVFSGASSMSLFSEKRMLDIRLSAKGVDRAGSDALRAYVENPIEGTLVLVRAGPIEWRQRTSAWFKALEKQAVLVLVPTISAQELPHWLDARAQSAGLKLSRDSIEAIVDRAEGNLLAVQQELEKLCLLDRPSDKEITVDDLSLGNTSHFETFELIDTGFLGDAPRARKMLRTLRQEGVPIYMVIGALAAQLRRAYHISIGRRERLAHNRKRAVDAVIARLGSRGIEMSLVECGRLDQQAKGMLRGEAWDSLERLILTVSGRSRSNLEREARYLLP